MKETVKMLLSDMEIAKRVTELAEEISNDYGDEDIFMLCVLKGSVIFLSDLARCMKKSVEIDFISLSSYGQSMQSSGKIDITKNLEESIEGKNVLIVEDIIDSGRTLKFLAEHIGMRNPKSIKVCTLLDKPEQRVADIAVDYVGFRIPDEFVVGYGLDYAQRYRNLEFIGALSFED